MFTSDSSCDRLKGFTARCLLGGPAPSRAAVLGPRNPEVDKTDKFVLFRIFHFSSGTGALTASHRETLCLRSLHSRFPFVPLELVTHGLHVIAAEAQWDLVLRQPGWVREPYGEDVSTEMTWGPSLRSGSATPRPHPDPPPYMNDRRQPWASVLCTLIISLMASYQPPSGPPLPWSVHGTWLTPPPTPCSGPLGIFTLSPGSYSSLCFSNDISCLPACIFVLSPAISVSCCRCNKSPHIEWLKITRTHFLSVLEQR